MAVPEPRSAVPARAIARLRTSAARLTSAHTSAAMIEGRDWLEAPSWSIVPVTIVSVSTYGECARRWIIWSTRTAGRSHAGSWGPVLRDRD
jgi:hypothetical protein